MLRIEKKSTFSRLTITWREKERFLESGLIKAFAMALTLHLAGFVLFHIKPFHFSSTFIFPPVEVWPDDFLQPSLVSTQLETEEPIDLPPQLLNLVPPLPPLLSVKHTALNNVPHLDIYAFDSLEERIWPSWHLPLEVEEQRVRIYLSGDLAHYSIVTKDLRLEQTQKITFPVNYHTVIYKVQLDERDGKVYWHERLHTSGNPSIDDLAEEMLLDLQFDTSHASFGEATGMITFIMLDTHSMQKS